ncbi:hypothetical protein EVAR_57374_1 [Eumeta japonica]|uniref:Uncharacterized protein n=1 Tax=Eumeta variegata TaxID=151549 RepID=A0A4C1ZGI4_EUMVA|nr:hypothetical protein EVAR_57374_1 [Eumeta japonica]
MRENVFSKKHTGPLEPTMVVTYGSRRTYFKTGKGSPQSARAALVRMLSRQEQSLSSSRRPSFTNSGVQDKLSRAKRYAERMGHEGVQPFARCNARNSAALNFVCDWTDTATDSRSSSGPRSLKCKSFKDLFLLGRSGARESGRGLRVTRPS